LKQQLNEKDRTISMLQQQMAKYCGVDGSCEDSAEKANVATQTERVRIVIYLKAPLKGLPFPCFIFLEFLNR